MADLEQAEIFLRGIVSVASIKTSYIWWDKIKHRYPDYEWNGENIVIKTGKSK